MTATTTRRLVTLAPDLDAPAFPADCLPGGWNGFHVPVVTAAEVVAHFAACRAADPGREAEWPTPFVDDAGTLRIPHPEAPEDRTEDTTYAPEADGRYLVDGLVWSSPYTDGEA